MFVRRQSKVQMKTSMGHSHASMSAYIGESMKMLLLMILIAAFCLDGLASAQALQRDETHEIAGTIKEVSPSLRRVIVETSPNLAKTVSIEPETKISLNGKESQLEDLKPGQAIRVLLAGESSKAISVRVISGDGFQSPA
jgi:hypothetical protein